MLQVLLVLSIWDTIRGINDFFFHMHATLLFLNMLHLSARFWSLKHPWHEYEQNSKMCQGNTPDSYINCCHCYQIKEQGRGKSVGLFSFFPHKVKPSQQFV